MQRDPAVMAAYQRLAQSLPLRLLALLVQQP
jgi:hypothetical protein